MIIIVPLVIVVIIGTELSGFSSMSIPVTTKMLDSECSSASSKGLKTIDTALLILIRTLHGCSLLENAGAYSPE